MTTTNTKTSDTKTEAKETLTVEERKVLLNCETSIRASLKAFYNAGRALAIIRTERLYRAEFSTFDKYASEKWDMTRQRVGQLIGSWRIYTMLKDHGFKTLPTTESQCRPFSRLPEDMNYDARVITVWTNVLDTAREKKQAVTAKLVDLAVDAILGVERKTTGEATGDKAAGQSAGATGATGQEQTSADQESESAKHREEVRQLRAKIAHLESALAAERQAHKRTRQATGHAVPQSKLAKDLFKAGFRAMAKQYHPDHGGDSSTMQELNSLKDELGI